MPRHFSTNRKTTMKFPGTNTVTLTANAVKELLMDQAPTIFGDPQARIVKIKSTPYGDGLEVTFTTDPEPTIDAARD